MSGFGLCWLSRVGYALATTISFDVIRFTLYRSGIIEVEKPDMRLLPCRSPLSTLSCFTVIINPNSNCWLFLAIAMYNILP